MHRAARRMLMTRRRGGYGAGSSPGAPMGGGGYNDGPGGSTLDSQTVHTGGGYDSNGLPSIQDIVDQELQQAGASPALVRGFHYNINAESGWDPNMRHVDQPHWGGEAHYSHGLLQEGGPEWAGLQAYASKAGTGWQDPRAQIQYAVQNLKNSGTWDRLNGSKNWQDAAAGLAKDYLRPANQYLQSRLNDIYGRKDFSNPSAAGQPYQMATATPSAGGVGTLTSGVPTTPDNVGMLSKLLGGNDAMGGNPMMGMAGSLMNQQAPAPQLNLPQPVHPNINPQVLQQQQALLHGILNPQFRGLMG